MSDLKKDTPKFNNFANNETNVSLLDTTGKKDISICSVNVNKKNSKKRIKFKNEIEYVNVECYKEFNVDIVNEKVDQSCMNCKECSLY
jgi:phosphoribosylpyrophosphate synthetase